MSESEPENLIVNENICSCVDRIRKHDQGEFGCEVISLMFGLMTAE